MIKNLEDALAPLKILSQKAIEAKMRGELTVANRIAEDARTHAPGSLEGLVNDPDQTEKTTAITVGSGGQESDIAAYVEFGTGTLNVEENIIRVAIDAGTYDYSTIEKEAAKFVVNKLGHGAAHPFFFPAIYKHREELIPEIEKELSKL